MNELPFTGREEIARSSLHFTATGSVDTFSFSTSSNTVVLQLRESSAPGSTRAGGEPAPGYQARDRTSS